MRVHIFGNSPSPAIATYGLRKAVEHCDPDVKHFVNRDFYVDDGLVSLPTEEKSIDLMTRTREALRAEGGIRLHKIMSNSADVMQAFPSKELGKDLKCLRLNIDTLPVQNSLGLVWDLESDSFVFRMHQDFKPYTRRGLLSTINSIYDPMGFLSPVTISGRILLRDASPHGANWDEPLPSSYQSSWETWRQSLHSLEQLCIPRMYVTSSLREADSVELHIFCDASEKAVAAAAYLKVTSDDTTNIGFAMGKSKLAPSKGNTIPRLELWGAVLAIEVGSTVLENLDITPSVIKYYTDSRVVLGYIQNRTRRFYTYVSNRVERIHKVSAPNQWSFVPSHLKPADSGTRYTTSNADLSESMWLQGPTWLLGDHAVSQTERDFPLLDPEEDKEIRPQTVTCKTLVSESITARFEKFSHWRGLVNAITLLRRVIQRYRDKKSTTDGAVNIDGDSVEFSQQSEKCIMRQDQLKFYGEEIRCFQEGRPLPRKSSILQLNSVIDSDGVLRVGGRLQRANIPSSQRNQVILSGKSHIARLVVTRIHEQVKHQGRFFTEGAIRNGGYWIVGAKRLISSIIHQCVICRKLRRKPETQKMADLPLDRLTPGPPFTSVGVDTFGPWEVSTRRTRGGSANSKRWAILFTCMTTRAVHIEVVEELSSSSFINALRRFEALRGPVKVYRSDRGTNFVGATDDLKINAVNVEDGPVKNFLHGSGTTWIFNPPHSSHMGGTWERLIGLTRKILDSMFLTAPASSKLTHEVLTTFMSEVCAIINSRPVAQISSDPESPMIISPSMLLTGKGDHLPVICDSCDLRSIYRSQWRHVQALSELFWSRWRKDYLLNLQTRRKWQTDKPNVKQGDIVLLRDQGVHRNEWPLGIVVNAVKSEDGRVRKVCVKLCKNGKDVTYVRPVSEIVVLID